MCRCSLRHRQHLPAGHPQRPSTPPRRGLLSGLSLLNYLKLVDRSARLLRDGKARLGAAAAPILQRLGIEAETFTHLWQKLHAALSGHARLGHRLGTAAEPTAG